MRSIQSVCLSVCEEGRDLEVETHRWTNHPVRKADIHMAKLLFFVFRLQTCSKYLLKPEDVSHLCCWTCCLLRGHSDILRIAVVTAGFHLQPLQIQMQAAAEAMPFNSRSCLKKKHRLSLLVDYSPVKPETESQTFSEQAETI